MMSHHFDDLCEQATFDLSLELIWPHDFHVKIQASQLDDQTFHKVMNGDPCKLKFWYDAINAELIALHKKACFEEVFKSEAEGQ